MQRNEIVQAFHRLGNVLRAAADDSSDYSPESSEWVEEFRVLISDSMYENPWFIPDFVRHRFMVIAAMLEADRLESWLENYDTHTQVPKKVLVVMAGNIPAVGFHDMLCVLVSGHSMIAKLSSEDQKIIPAMARFLISENQRFADKVEFSTSIVKNFDAVIATGSDNTSRYFNYYFGRYPNIIRRNRNSLAIIYGDESKEAMQGIVADILLYFGKGCRSVSQIMVPKSYDFSALIEVMQSFSFMAHHSKFANNYDYQKAIALVNGHYYMDSGFLLLLPSDRLSAAVGVLHYSSYDKPDDCTEYCNRNKDFIQCVVSDKPLPIPTVRPGKAQYTGLIDYADEVDTLDFLIKLKK